MKNLGCGEGMGMREGRERGGGSGGVQPLLELFRNVDGRENGPNRVDLFCQRQKVVRDYPRVTFSPSPFL